MAPASPVRVTLFMSISVNGYIARPNGSEDFFTNVNWTAFVELARKTGAMAWGRTTHEAFRQAVGALEGVQGFVLTTNPRFPVEKGWKVVGSPEQAVEAAARAGCREMLVVGGSTVNGAFARAGLVDRVVLDVESVIVGEGIPLLAPTEVDLPLRFRKVEQLTPSVLQLHYDVVREGHDHGHHQGHSRSDHP